MRGMVWREKKVDSEVWRVGLLGVGKEQCSGCPEPLLSPLLRSMDHTVQKGPAFVCGQSPPSLGLVLFQVTVNGARGTVRESGKSFAS